MISIRAKCEKIDILYVNAQCHGTKEKLMCLARDDETHFQGIMNYRTVLKYV